MLIKYFHRFCFLFLILTGDPAHYRVGGFVKIMIIILLRHGTYLNTEISQIWDISQHRNMGDISGQKYLRYGRYLNTEISQIWDTANDDRMSRRDDCDVTSVSAWVSYTGGYMGLIQVMLGCHKQFMNMEMTLVEVMLVLMIMMIMIIVVIVMMIILILSYLVFV